MNISSTKDGHENLEADLLAHLRLTAALDKNCYDILAKAKVAELEDIFQTKLGWLKGNIYSRVATPDYAEREANPKEILDGFIEKYTPKDDQVWLSTIQAENLRKIIREKPEPIIEIYPTMKFTKLSTKRLQRILKYWQRT